MERWKERTLSLIGEEAALKLKHARVAVFGMGGVGGILAEALVRAGIGELDVFDGDCFTESNLNRQILCTTLNLGENKAAAAAERFKTINPEIIVNVHPIFFNSKTDLDFSFFDYVADAIDSTEDKLELYRRARRYGVRIISAMGTGNKMNPAGFIVGDISETDTCPLAKKMRKLCKDEGITGVKVVYSKETPVVRPETPASISFVPPAAGLLMASEIIKDIIAK